MNQIFIPFILSSFFFISQISAQFGNSKTVYSCADCGQRDIRTVDLDGDGDEEILVTYATGPSRMGWLDNLGNGKFSTLKVLTTEDVAGKYVTAADLDGDGDKEILASFDSPYKIVWHDNLGNGSFGSENILTTNVFSPTIIESGDFDKDGDLDLFATSVNFNGILFFTNDGSGQFEADTILEGYRGSHRYKAIDLNLDGHLDIVGMPASRSQLYLFENDGTGIFTPRPLIILEPNVFANGFDIADLDNDGDLDITYSTNNDRLLWSENIGDTEYGPFKWLESQIDFVWTVKAGDFDDDGDNDILFSSGEDTNIAWYENNGDKTFGEKHIVTNQIATDDMQLSDYDLDGDKDLVILSGYPGSRVLIFENYSKSGIISGYIFHDNNGNGMRDSTEELLRDNLIKIKPNPITYSLSDSSGFEFHVSRDTYQLTIKTDPCWSLTTPYDTIEVSVDTGQTINLAFGVQLNESHQEINARLTSSPTRCGFTVPFWLSVRNDGCAPASGQTGIVLHELATLLVASEAPDITNGDTLWWNYPELLSGEVFSVRMEFQIAGVDFLGDTIRIPVMSHFNDAQGIPSWATTHQFQRVINCSYDPNDKLVYPYRDERNFTLTSEELIYVVRFQNTGTDTAFRVEIRDRLDPSLDETTLRFIEASHHCTAAFNLQARTFQVVFDNIELPDSSTNQAGSHGYVTFGIKSRGTGFKRRIENTAKIYFDFNPPISTNTVASTIVQSFRCRDSIGVDGKLVAPLTADLLAQDVLCYGEHNGKISLKLLNGTPPYWIRDSLVTDTFTLDMLSPGQYKFNYADNGNCADSVLVWIDEPDSLRAFFYTDDASWAEAQDGRIELGSIWGGSPPYLFTWSDGSHEEDLENLSPGTYSVTVEDANHCFRTYDFTIGFTVGIKDVENGSMRIAPNPFSNEVSINYSNEEPATIQFEIYDAAGKIIHQHAEDLTAGEHVIQLDGKLFPASGFYFLKMIRDEDVFYVKMEKVRK